MAYIDCDKCSHGKVCAYRHQYDDHIVTCSHWKPVAEERKLTHQKIVSELDGADVFLRGRATSKTASLNEYDIEVLLGIANVCDEAADFIQRQKAENERLRIDSTYADNFARDLCEKRLLNGKEIADFGDLQEYIEDQKAEAIKAFAVRLKEPFEIFTDAREADALYMVGLIDTLVKEMTEDTK